MTTLGLLNFKETRRLLETVKAIQDPEIKREYLDFVIEELQNITPGKLIESRTFPAGRGIVANFNLVRTEQPKRKFKRSKNRVCFWRVKAKYKGQEDISLVRWKDKFDKWRNTIYPLGVSLSREELIEIWASMTLLLNQNKISVRQKELGKEFSNALIKQKDRLDKNVKKNVQA